MSSSAKVTGWNTIKLNVAELEKRITRGAMRTAITKAARLATAAAKANAPVGRTGLLKKSIKQKVVTNTRKGIVSVYVGPSRKTVGKDPLTGQIVRPSKYAHLVEFGVSARGVYGKKGVSVPTEKRPNPFLRTAYESTKSAMVSKYESELGPAIEKTAARIHKSTLNRLSK